MIRIKKSFVKQILPAPTHTGSSLSSFNIRRLVKTGMTMFILLSIENQKGVTEGDNKIDVSWDMLS